MAQLLNDLSPALYVQTTDRAKLLPINFSHLMSFGSKLQVSWVKCLPREDLDSATLPGIEYPLKPSYHRAKK